ncbi:MAG TPA: DUF2383 domain-containing protein [Polyangiaceae bacterium]|nr:DUF2383 domain-containing protein [Polyangiaceae bacterium]
MTIKGPDPASTAVAQLNAFLRGELSAVATYHDVLPGVRGHDARATLRDCALSHERRVRCLRDAIVRLGGTPDDSPGAWGAFAGLDQGARAPGDWAAVSALARGEDRGLDAYRHGFGKLDERAKELVEQVLLPAQQQTRHDIHELKRLLLS